MPRVSECFLRAECNVANYKKNKKIHETGWLSLSRDLRKLTGMTRNRKCSGESLTESESESERSSRQAKRAVDPQRRTLGC